MGSSRGTRRRSTARSGLVAVVAWSWACGPTVDLDASTEATVGPATAATTTGAVASTGLVTSGQAPVTSTMSPADSRGDGIGTTRGTAGTTRVDDGPIFDVLIPDAPPSLDLPMYSACWNDDQCAPGLQCVTFGYAKLLVYAMCTAPCLDPVVDCDPAPVGWSTTCAVDLPRGDSAACAIACDDGDACPEGTWCLHLLTAEGTPQPVCMP